MTNKFVVDRCKKKDFMKDANPELVNNVQRKLIVKNLT